MLLRQKKRNVAFLRILYVINTTLVVLKKVVKKVIMNTLLFLIVVIILFFLSAFLSDYVDVPEIPFINPKTKKKKRSPHSYLRQQITKIPFRCQSRFYSQELFPGLKEIQENWQIIREEAMNVYKNAPVIDTSITEKKAWCKEWNSLTSSPDENCLKYDLIMEDHIVPANGEACPKTIEMLSQIEGIHSARFSWLKPHALIYRHNVTTGLEYNSLAYRLGLIVSKECHLLVDEEKNQEEEGSVLIFDATFAHCVQNGSDEDSISLEIDFKLIGL